MARIRRCDRCGATVEDDPSLNIEWSASTETCDRCAGDLIDFHDHPWIDVCPGCQTPGERADLLFRAVEREVVQGPDPVDEP